MLVLFSSSSPVQAPLRGPVRPAIYLMAYAFLVFPSKPFSMQQPECSFKNTHLFLSLLRLNCFPLYFDDVQNAHMTCRAFLSDPCMAQASGHPSPHRLVLILLLDWSSLSQHHVGSLSTWKAGSPCPIPHSQASSASVPCHPFDPQIWICPTLHTKPHFHCTLYFLLSSSWDDCLCGNWGVFVGTHLWGPCCEHLAVPPLSPWLSEFILPVLQG